MVKLIYQYLLMPRKRRLTVTECKTLHFTKSDG